MASFKEKIKEIIWGNQDQTDFVDADQAADQIIDLVEELIGENDKRVVEDDYDDYKWCSTCDQIIGNGEDYSRDCRCTVRNRLKAKLRQKLRRD